MLNGILWLVSGVAAVLVLVLCPAVAVYWAPALLMGGYVAAGALYVVALFVFTLCLPKKAPEKPRCLCLSLLELSCRWVLPFLRCRLETEGLEGLPEEPFLLVGNHRSNLDPIVTVAALSRRRMAFVSKPENFRYPVAGPLIRHCGFLALDRENVRHAVATIQQAAHTIRELGLPMGIYPEGTRNKTEDLLLPFHAGSFKIAKKAACPIAVVTVSYGKPGFLGFRRVRLSLAGVLDRETVVRERTDGLSELARGMMEKALNADAARE